MARRCSHCSNNGHNFRTCPSRGGGGGGGVKLFGVRLTDGSIIKKSASMGNLSSALYHSSSSAAASPNSGSPSSDLHRDSVYDVPDGYLSDDPTHASCSANRRADRKKGIPWTEEEHQLFLLGLQKLGKGDWRGISRNYVTSRTPTQVASHAQKYFIRQNNATRRKRRSSLFDMVPQLAADLPPLSEDQVSQTLQAIESDSLNALPSLNLSLKPEFDSMENTTHEMTEETKETAMATKEIPEIIPSFIPAYIPLSFSLWPSNACALKEETEAEKSHHQVLKPVPVLPKEPVNVDELVGMSQLSLREGETSHAEPPPLSLSLLTDPSRQSAFHASAPVSRPDVNTGNSSAIKAV